MNNYYFSSWITPRLYEISNNNYKLAHKKHMNSRTRKVTKILTKCLSKLWTRTSTNPIIPHGILTQVHPLFNLLQCNSHFSLIFFFFLFIYLYIFFIIIWWTEIAMETWNAEIKLILILKKQITTWEFWLKWQGTILKITIKVLKKTLS